MTRYRYSTCLSFGDDGEANYCELDVTVSFTVAWGSPDEVEDIRLELVDGKPLTGCEFIEPVLSRFEEEDELRDAMLQEARETEAARGA